MPSGPDDVIITNGTWEQLDEFISNDAGLDAARGRIVGRNASIAPWSHTLDVKIAQDIPIKNTKIQITLDILNLVNLFDRNSGVVKYARFGTLDPIDYIGLDEATGKPIYALDGLITDPENNDKFDISSGLSRWRARLGLRFTF